MYKKFILIHLLFFSCLSLFAKHEVHFSTPEKTIAFYLESVEQKDWDKAKTVFVGSEKSLLLEKKALTDFAAILTELIRLGTKPKKQETSYLITYPYKKNGIHFFLSETDKNWLISPGTRDNISKLYEESGLDKFTAMPAYMNKKTFLLLNWQWFGMFIIILISVFFQWFIQFFIKKIVRKATSKIRPLKEERKINRAILILTMSITWYILLPFLNLPLETHVILLKGITLLTLVSGIIVVNDIINIIFEILSIRAEKTETKVDDVLIPLLRKTIKIVFTAVGIVFIADNLNLNVGSLLAGLGLGGLAFALAAKDTIENIFGSITVLLDRPFAIGDWIVVEGVEGTVESIGLRSTRIRTFYCSQISIPNSTLINAKVDNYGRRSYRRIKTMISLTYSTPPGKIEAFCEGIRQLIREHPYTRKDYYHVYLNQFSAASLDVLLYCFIDVDDWAIELREKQRLFVDILRLAGRLGVEFAFPTQTLYMADSNDDPKAELKTSWDDIEKSINDGKTEASGIVLETLMNKEKPGVVQY